MLLEAEHNQNVLGKKQATTRFTRNKEYNQKAPKFLTTQIYKTNNTFLLSLTSVFDIILHKNVLLVLIQIKYSSKKRF